MRFRFVHAADVHLDAPFLGLRRVAPFVAETLRDASLEAFEALVALAIAREAAFVVLAGGLYAGPEHGIRAQVALRQGLTRLSRAGITTCLVLSERDRLPADGWPPLVHVLGPDPVRVERDGNVLATVQGGDAVQRDDDRVLAVGVRHGEVDPDELRAAGLDYWALGGGHARRVLHERDPWIVYPGATQGRSHETDERGAKGALVVDVDGRTPAAPEFVALDRVRCATLTAEVGGLGDLAELTRHLSELAEAEADKAERRSVLLRVRLVGTGPVVPLLRRQGAVAELLAGLRDARAEAEEPFVWWEHLVDATSRPLDLEALRRRGDFTGALLDAADELSTDEPALQAFTTRHLPAAPPDVLPLVGALPDPDPQRITDLAIDALTSDD